MNAIIALCHFCESHGPCVVFCTQSLRDTKIPEESMGGEVNCGACMSLGHDVGMLSKHKGGVNYFSSQKPVIKDVVRLLRQACIRSLSCEVSQCKDGGFVYYGDTARGHVLSHTFQIRDSQARGFNRWFSIIILMKDKMFLLNVTPFLSENLKVFNLCNRQLISQELQAQASAVYQEDQSRCSQRALRLTVDNQVPSGPRSLPVLTNQPHVFAHLHSHFTWLLWAGGQCLTERIVQGCLSVPPWMGKETEEGFTLVQIDQAADTRGGPIVGDSWTGPSEVPYTLRELKNLLGETAFTGIVYCALVGIQIIVRGPENTSTRLVRSLRCLFPSEVSPPCSTGNSGDYLSASEARLQVLSSQVAVPQPCAAIFRVDIVDNSYTIKWLGHLPEKWPTLLWKINKGVNDSRLHESTLANHVNALIEEWQNTATVLFRAKMSSNADLGPLKQALGVQQQDTTLIEYWSDRCSRS